MSQAFDFEVAGLGPKTIHVSHGVIAGWTGRNADAVAHHIAELEAIGVAPPSTVPLYYRVAPNQLTTSAVIATVGNTSSGEAEPVLVDDGETLYLGLGSDHTDRELEAHSVALSKQICAKPLAPVLWRFEEVAGHLDEIAIRSFVRDSEDAAWTAYQDGTLAGIRPLAELAQGSPLAAGGTRLAQGTVMMCGTFAVLSGGVRPARFFRMEMEDRRLGRTIAHCYEAEILPVVS